MTWSETILGGLLEAVPDAVLVVEDGRIVQVNDRCEQLYGWSRGELTGQDIEVVLPRAGSVVRSKDGSETPAECSRAEVDGREVIVVRASDSRLRMESLARLAGRVAHDFNNMLGVIVNYATFVVEEAEGDEPDAAMMATDARQVIKASERGTDLTRQLLAFARREAPHPQVLDLNAVIAEREPVLREVAGEHVTVLVRPGAGLPAISGDPAQLEQLLVHLVANARDAMPSGGNVIITTDTSGNMVRMRVADAGRGMAPEVRLRAFEPYYTTRGKNEANGMGLAIVWGIVAQAGGEVSIDSVPGLGTTVSVLFPALSLAASSSASAGSSGSV